MQLKKKWQFAEMKLREHSYCSFCGAPQSRQQRFPRTCRQCGNTTYRHPSALVTVLVPVEEAGLLVIRRGYDGFGGGKLALPGGFMEYGETWQEAAAREVAEETNVRIDPAQIALVGALSVQEGKRLVLACLAAPVSGKLPPFTAGTEILERVVITAPVPLAYPSHLMLTERFFARTLPIFPVY